MITPIIESASSSGVDKNDTPASAIEDFSTGVIKHIHLFIHSFFQAGLSSKRALPLKLSNTGVQSLSNQRALATSSLCWILLRPAIRNAPDHLRSAVSPAVYDE